MNHADFSYTLILDFIAETIGEPRLIKHGRQAQGPPEECLDGTQHCFERKQKPVTYVVGAKNSVRKETIYFWKTCKANPSSYPEGCFEACHKLSKYIILDKTNFDTKIYVIR